MSRLYTHLSHTKHVVHDLFNVLNNHETFKLHRMGIEKQQQFAVYASDTPIYIYIYITFKQSQGHQTWYDSVDLEHGYNRAKFCDLFPGSQGVQVDKRVILGGGKGIGRGREGGGRSSTLCKKGGGGGGVHDLATPSAGESQSDRT